MIEQKTFTPDTITASLFARDCEASMIIFVVGKGVIKPISVENFGADHFDIIGAITELEPDEIVVNPDPGAPSGKESSLELELKQHKVCGRVQTLDSVNPPVALLILNRLQASGHLSVASFSAWPVIEKEIQQMNLSKSVRLLAFLQGVVAASKEADRGKGVGFGMRIGGGRRYSADGFQPWRPFG